MSSESHVVSIIIEKEEKLLGLGGKASYKREETFLMITKISPYVTKCFCLMSIFIIHCMTKPHIVIHWEEFLR